MTTVLHVFEALEGGTARHVVDLVRSVTSVRHVVVAPPRRAGLLSDRHALSELAETGADVRLVDMRRTPVHPVNALALARITGIVRRHRPDVIHGHAAIGGVMARLAAPWHPAPRVYSPHQVHPSRLVLGVERLLARRTSRIVGVSPSQGAELVSLRIADPASLVVVPHGVALEPPGIALRDVRALVGAPPDAQLVGLVGRVVAQKRPLDFVEACRVVAARRPGTHFVMIGAGSMVPTVLAAAAAAGLGARFHHLPELRGAGWHMGQLDVLLVLSDREGGPLVAYEAMREGTPVVATRVTGSRDAVVDGLTGFLVPLGDPGAAGQAVLRILGDRALAARLADAARRRVAGRFTIERMAAAYTALYRELAPVGQEPGGRPRMPAA